MSSDKIIYRQDGKYWIAYADYGVILAKERSRTICEKCAEVRYPLFKE